MNLLPEHIKKILFRSRMANCATVLFSLPGEQEYTVWLQDLNQPVHPASVSFIFHPFVHAEAPELLLHPTCMNDAALEHLDKAGEGEFWTLDTLTEQYSTSQEEYERSFSKIKNAIATAECSKAVLSTVIKKSMPATFDFGAFLGTLRKEYPGAFVYLFTSPLGGTWIGATPETLLKWEPGEVSTMSLAGTRNTSLGTSFGNKEMNEQEFVTRYIEDLFHASLGNYAVSPLEELKYGNLVHLVTRVTGKTPAGFNKEGLVNLANALHPTPAVGGTPKDRAIQLIRGTEEHPRFYYSGYLGSIGEESARLFVNLRCMSITGDSMYVFAGGGITAESDAAHEWQETRFKADSLLKFV